MCTIEDVIEHYQPEKVILFGSRAAGDGAEDSDWDYLIIKQTDTPRLHRREEALPDTLDVPADLLILTPAEVDQLSENNSSLIRTILETGKVVYERE